MSMIGDALGAVRRLALMDSEIEGMKQAIDKHDAKLTDHGDRLIRIETLIEFGRPRLPRG